MAFWGIEIKPGKPYTFPSDDDERGRLHVSQATLGAASSGSSTKKSIVQCQVGDKSPIYLCSLLPEKLETCALNLEFEEDEEVTLSVSGPHSVHLSGFFYPDEEEQDHDEDCQDEDCNGCGLDGVGFGSEGEDDSIDYSEDEDDTIDYSEDEEDVDDLSEDEDDLGLFPTPVPNSGVKIEEIVDDVKPTNGNVTSKQAKKKKTQSSMPDENDNSNREIVPKARTSVPDFESEDEDGFPVSVRDNKSEANIEKSQNKSEKTESAPGKNLKRKSGAVSQDEKPAGGSIEPHGSSIQPDTTENEIKQKKNKKKKVAQKLDSSPKNEKPNPDGMEKTPETGNDLKPSSKKKKENKKKKQNKLQENASTPTTGEKLTNKNGSVLKKQEKEEAKSSQLRTFPNGLVIEELVMGKPAAKRASPGNKVSVHYIGRLKKNGKIFDSNIGRAPFKFRLGISQVIKGWDVGVNGMRIGDKRRITIPPAMGYGAKGAGPDIPPNAWLEFDVELVDAY